MGRRLTELSVRPEIVWWNPVYWMLPSEGITAASALAAVLSFAWFMRNPVNQHLFRLPVPAWEVSAIVAIIAALFWQRLTRKPNTLLCLLWLQSLTMGAVALSWRAYYAETPRGTPILHAAPLAIGVALMALFPRFVPARPLSVWLRWITPIALLASTATAWVAADKTETAVIATARATIFGLSNRLNAAAEKIREASSCRLGKLTITNYRGVEPVPGFDPDESGAVDAAAYARDALAILRDPKVLPIDRFDMESAGLLHIDAQVKAALASLVSATEAALRAPEAPAPNYGPAPGDVISWPDPQRSKPALAGAVQYFTALGEISRRIETVGALYGPNSELRDLPQRMRSLAAEREGLRKRFSEDLSREWIAAAVNGTWDHAQPDLLGQGSFPRIARGGARRAVGLPGPFRVVEWLRQYSLYPASGCVLTSEPLPQFSKSFPRPPKQEPPPDPDDVVEYTVKLARCISWWSFDHGESLEPAAAVTVPSHRHQCPEGAPEDVRDHEQQPVSLRVRFDFDMRALREHLRDFGIPIGRLRSKQQNVELNVLLLQFAGEVPGRSRLSHVLRLSIRDEHDDLAQDMIQRPSLLVPQPVVGLLHCGVIVGVGRRVADPILEIVFERLRVGRFKRRAGRAAARIERAEPE